MNMNVIANLDALDDAQAAAAFRRLVRHLRHRHDAQNIELMGLAGFCRNCLADWIVEAGAPFDKAAARAPICQFMSFHAGQHLWSSMWS